MNAGGDQIAVKPDLSGMTDELGEIPADERLTAGEMDLQHAQPRRLRKDALPGCSVQLRAGAQQSERVRAIRATKRAAMRQLGQQSERRIRPRHACSTFLSMRSC